MIKNLLDETRQLLEDNGLSLDDIEAVFGEDFQIPVAEFLRLAGETAYEASYGRQWVASDLTVLLKSGDWLTRGEYDGSEWWDFHRRPSPPVREVQQLRRLTSVSGWETLAGCNQTEEEQK